MIDNRKYIPSTVADQLSNALWRLSDPNCDGKGTLYLFDWSTDLHGNGWLVVLTDAVIYVDPNAVLGEIGVILQPWIDNQTLPQNTMEVLAEDVAAHAASGEPLNVYNAMPQYFKDISKDRAAMIAEGLISAPNIDSQQMAAPKPQAQRAKPR